MTGASTIRRRCKRYDALVQSHATAMLGASGMTLLDGWEIIAAAHGAGRCHWHKQVVTIPVWVIEDGAAMRNGRSVRFHNPDDQSGYLEYYIAHELAHVFAGPKAAHGPVFMEWFRRICPAAYQHWELGYKPRGAKAAGIAA